MVDVLKAFFLSDVHITGDRDKNAVRLAGFIDRLGVEIEASHLFLVGDIFDLWVGPHAYFVQRFQSVVDAVQRAKSRGIEVHYFEGNHDLHLTKYWTKTLGVPVHKGPKTFRLDDLNVRVEHGDQMDPEDKGYLFLRWFLRTPVMTLISHHLPGGVVRRIGEKMSHSSRHYTSHVKTTTDDRTCRVLRSHAETVFEQQPDLDFLISGHVHLEFHELIESRGRARHVINLGSWFDAARVFCLTNSSGQFWRIRDDGSVITS